MKTTRLGKVALFVAALLVAGGISSIDPPAAHAADDFDVARASWVWHMTGGAANTSDPKIAPVIAQITARASTNQSTLDTSPTRTYLWSDLPDLSTNDRQLALSFSRLKDMALAYQTHGSSLRGNGALVAQIKSALLWLVTNHYNSSTAMYGNWWFWRIGIPLDVNDIVALTYDQMTATERAQVLGACKFFSNGATGTGSNVAWVNSIMLVRAVLMKDAAALGVAKTNLINTFAALNNPGFPGTINEIKEGYYADGSYLMHGGDPSNGGYAMDHLKHLAWDMHMLYGTAYAFTGTQMSAYLSQVVKTHLPIVFKGAIVTTVRGRAIARYSAGDHDRGTELIGSLAILAAQAPTNADAQTINRLIKYWVLNSSQDVYVNQGIANIRIIQDLMNNASILPAPAPNQTTLFPAANRIVAVRPDWGFAVAMWGGRTFNYEFATGENVRGWHTGDGAAYLYNGDGNAYDGNFWPTVDSQKIPGTTIVDGSTPNGHLWNTNYWVGGTTLTTASGASYGSAGMDQAFTSIVAKKSWFMFDDEVVALDAGITATSAGIDRTIVDNRKLKPSGDNAVTVTTASGPTTYTGTTMSSTIAGVKSIHLAGNTAGADVGYYFPTPASLDVGRAFRTDKWSSIQLNGELVPPGDPSYTESYLTISNPYVAQPTNASFAYVLLPNSTQTQVNSYQATPETTILRNDATAQAVSESTLGIVAANFWTDAVTTISSGGSPWVTSDKKAAVITQKTGGELRVSLSDPTQKNTGTINLEIAQAVTGTLNLGPGVTVTQTSPTLKLSIDVNAVRGMPIESVFTY